MSNEFKEWFADMQIEAYEAVSEIALIYENYHNTAEEACELIGKVLKEHGFID